MPLHALRPHVFALVFLLVAWWAPAPALTNALAAGAAGQSQDKATRPQVMQQAANEVAGAKLGPLQPSESAVSPPLAVGGAGGLTREVFGFAYASSLSDPNIGYPSWNFDYLSTVAFFGLHVNWDGTFSADSGLSVWNSSQVSNLVSTAHSHATKVVLTIILQDFATGTPTMCDGLFGSNAATTIKNTVAEVKAKGVDGVNIDYEGLNGSCGRADPNWARHAMTSFVQNVRAAIGGAAYISVDTYGSSAADPYGFFDVPGIATAADSLFVMAYDMEYANQNYPPTSCSGSARLKCLGPTSPLTGYRYNDTDEMAQYTSAIPASKVILGVPYYGRKACVASAAANQVPVGAVTSDGYQDAAAESMYVYTQPGSFSAHRDANDPTGLERWDTWYNTQLGCTRELYWDDTTSLAQKYALVNRDGLRGVGIWTLNYGGSASELWATLAANFGPWRASYDMSKVPINWSLNQAQTFPVTVTNSGGRYWLATGYNAVDLGIHFAWSSGGAPNQGAWLTSKAFSLPSDVGPGGQVTVMVTVSPPVSGPLILEAEMIKEHEFWFDQFAPLLVHVTGPTYAVSYDMSKVPTNWSLGQAQTFPVTVQNTGNQYWFASGYTAVELGIHFAWSSGGAPNQGAWLTSQAFSLPFDVGPGGMVTVMVTASPPVSGPLILEAEMIKEHAFWFTQFAPLLVHVTGPTYSAVYDMSKVPTNWVLGQAQTFPVAVQNTGNQYWFASGYTAVDLDLHFAWSSGGAPNQGAWLTSQAFSLPVDVGPGGRVTVMVTMTPPVRGPLILEAEMIKEHAFWFTQYAPLLVHVS